MAVGKISTNNASLWFGRRLNGSGGIQETIYRSKVYVNLVEHAQDNKLETRNKYIF